MAAPSSRPLPSDPSLPQVFGRYLLLERLSRGGMGEIFLAKHGLSGFEKICVIKKVLPNLSEDEHFISRFVDEAQVAIQLQHANIAQVFEVGRVDDEYFLSIEFVEGRDLRRTLAALHELATRFPPDLALFVAREVCNGLSYAHRRESVDGTNLRLVHCDISPPNVMLSFEGEIKLIDFGIAKSALRGTVTDPKMGFGKFGYMAPEQLIRGGVVDHRTDIYAAGVVLYELLVGERMYDTSGTPDYRALARMVAKGQHPLPSQLDAALAPYDALVAKALCPKPEDRYQTAAEFRDAIQHVLVGINPTMSSDALGAYMRQLFSADMEEQRRLAAAALATSLEPWESQLTTHANTTVSFALAHLPLAAPRTELVDRLPTPTGVSTIVAAPVGRRRSGRALLAGLAAATLLIGGSVMAWVLGNRTEPAAPRAAVAPAPASAAAPTPAPGERVAEAMVDQEPLEMPAELVDRPDAAPAPAPEPPEAAPARKPPTRTTRRPPRAAPKEAPEPPEPRERVSEAERNRVLEKFRSLSADYRRFTAKYGERLGGEWASLATYAQFARTSPDKMRLLDERIDKFRARMRAIGD